MMSEYRSELCTPSYVPTVGNEKYWELSWASTLPGLIFTSFLFPRQNSMNINWKQRQYRIRMCFAGIIPKTSREKQKLFVDKRKLRGYVGIWSR